MNDEQTAAIYACSQLSMKGEISFADVVGRLMGVGVERYHADYTRMENTYYLPDGESHVVAMKHAPYMTAEEFSAAEVAESIAKAQRGDIMYPEFVHQTAAAGCVGYFVQITGQQVQYFGRNGELHVELFPGAKNKKI